MRSTIPMEGNPWPHDMVITIDDSPHQVMELLWVREACGLHPSGDAPPPLVDTPPRSGTTVDVGTWENAWPEVWDAVIRHAAGVIDAALFDEVRNTADGSPERAELLLRMRGPAWRDRFGDAAFDESYLSWSEKRFHERTRTRPRSLAESPERVSLDALVPAWEAGLAKVITIPCRGEYTRVVGGSALLMTESTRSDPERYAAALGTFR